MSSRLRLVFHQQQDYFESLMQVLRAVTRPALRACCRSSVRGSAGRPGQQIWAARQSEARLLHAHHQELAEIAPGNDTPSTTRQQDAHDHAKRVPHLCPGCGSHSHTIDQSSPGFYDVNKVRNAPPITSARKEEDAVYALALKQGLFAAEHDAFTTTAADAAAAVSASTTATTPICDRCHQLAYHSRGTPILHPSMTSIQSIIEESPHKHNHIYHVLDAADFPLSLIPNLQHSLNLPKLRTRNRRSKNVHYSRNRIAEVSFIITRSDLLAPQKEQVDKLMPYLQEVLREALSRGDRNIRLGNVRCVSAKRGWWTKTVKEEVYERGGAGWMVGKVNVGKSALFEVVFPKGRGAQDVNVDKMRREAGRQENGEEKLEAASAGELGEAIDTTLVHRAPEIDDLDDEIIPEDLDDESLLPPSQPETAFPTMPLVSALPGTTASPIRIPFGSGRGELIDLPGIHRSFLDQHVREEHRKDLVMKSRVVPEQHTIKSGQSLLLGGLIRITPKLEDGEVVLAYPFVPPAFEPHVTGTHKAVAITTGFHGPMTIGKEGEPYKGEVATIATEEAKGKMKSAGVYKLEWDVTKKRTGPITNPAAGKQKAESLPYVVFSADMLVEGVGWVELVCQVRRNAGLEGDVQIPEVEVFSPDGKAVGWRRPLGAWGLGGKKVVPVHKRRERPRMSIGMTKRRG